MEVILFDLDGTLTDPKTGITNAVSHALAKMGVNRAPDSLTGYIGPPLRDMFMQSEGFNTAQAEQAVAYYREYFASKGIFENILYPGVAEMLFGLKGIGRKIAVATTKPHIYAKKILRHFGIEQYIDFVSGSEMDGSRSDKQELITYVLDKLGASCRQAVMVGDRFYDAEGARKMGMDFIGVLYGYGARDEFLARGIDESALVSSVGELYARLVG